MINNDGGQGLLSKYVWVINTIHRAGRISFADINRRWVADTDISRGAELPKRTFDNWQRAIQDIFGLIIENEGRGAYRYYILNDDDIESGGLQSWLYDTLCVSNLLAGSQSIKDRILLEHVPSGQEYLQPIIEAMKENRVLNMTYYSYWKDAEYSFDVQPYCVRLFRQRWYMVARSTTPYYYNKGLFTYSLDRILDLRTTDKTFKMPDDWDAEAFFDGCFGIIADHTEDIQDIRLKASADQANYLRDLPLHPSQEEVEQNDEYSIFTYRLRRTDDFIQELLWHGDAIEVQEPASLRKEMKEIIHRMQEKYKHLEVVK